MDKSNHRKYLEQQISDAEGELEDLQFEVDRLERKIDDLYDELRDFDEEEELDNDFFKRAKEKLGRWLTSDDPAQVGLFQ